MTEFSEFSVHYPSGGGGGNYHVCWYEMCRFLGCLFSGRKINFMVSFLVKSQVNINLGCHLRKNNSLGY